MTAAGNPWTDRFRGLTDDAAIKQATRVAVDPLHNLDVDSPAVAEMRMRETLRRLFRPTASTCALIRAIVDVVLGHASTSYPDQKTYLARVYGSEKWEPPKYPLMLLTGLSGTGKSEICRAITRLFPQDSSLWVDEAHPAVPLSACRLMVAQTRSSPVSLLRPFASPGIARGSARCSLAELPGDCAAWLYLSGVCLGIADELQFVSSSDAASTVITQALLSYILMGTPFLACMNYSLVQKLQRRRSEERRRIFGRTFVLVPDSPDSDDWLCLLDDYQAALPGVFSFELRAYGLPLWSFVAGVRGHLLSLLLLSYRLVRDDGRTIVDWEDIDHAYLHRDFLQTRAEVEELILHGYGSQELREDLRCPLPMSSAEAYRKELDSARKAKVAAAALHAASSDAERKAKALIERVSNPPAAPSAANPVVRQRKARKLRTAGSMREAGERFRQRLRGGRQA